MITVEELKDLTDELPGSFFKAENHKGLYMICLIDCNKIIIDVFTGFETHFSFVEFPMKVQFIRSKGKNLRSITISQRGHKLMMVKFVKYLLNIGLKEAKDLCDNGDSTFDGDSITIYFKDYLVMEENLSKMNMEDYDALTIKHNYTWI